MAQWVNKLRSCTRTANLTMLLVLNLFFVVTLNLTVATVLVVLGVDNGFFFRNGEVSIGGALVILYASCILMAISLVVAIRLVLIKPMVNSMQAMNRLAAGDFAVRLEPAKRGYEPEEIKAFKAAFNKAAQELSGTELLRKDFVNNFSHEFKTPIVSISGFADLLLEEDVAPEEQREYLQIIRDESRRLAQLSSSVLLLNRVESQTILNDRTDFLLDEQLRQSVLVTQQKWREKLLTFDADIAPCRYNGSEALLKEIWLNLLDNAAKFSPEGGVIGVTLRIEQGSVVVSITDQGCGMDEETRRHIFEQFYQGDTSHKTQGNGLGLTMAQKIAALHGGNITADSRPGAGSCVTVRLAPEVGAILCIREQQKRRPMDGAFCCDWQGSAFHGENLARCDAVFVKTVHADIIGLPSHQRGKRDLIGIIDEPALVELIRCNAVAHIAALGVLDMLPADFAVQCVHAHGFGVGLGRARTLAVAEHTQPADAQGLPVGQRAARHADIPRTDAVRVFVIAVGTFAGNVLAQGPHLAVQAGFHGVM